MPLIVLEGPEGAGKTTLGRKIEEVLRSEDAADVQYIHNGAPIPPFTGQWTAQSAWNARKSMTQLYTFQYAEASNPPYKWTIIDRAHLSEIVYGHTRRGLEEWNAALDHYLHVRAWTPYSRQRLYVVLADPQTLAERETGETFPTADVIHRLTKDRGLFYQAYRRTSWPVGLIDMTSTDVRSMARSIIDDNVPIKMDSWNS